MDSSAYMLTLMIMHTQCLPNTMHTYIFIYIIYIYTGEKTMFYYTSSFPVLNPGIWPSQHP